ncbi:activating signal cointegrator 1 complex subunit 1 [Trichonephila inaurata madagascariensis]|uniref:Activating signal cointegrator 1 complex subunit 1 n=1 Tax=Trichonephila inaurata madagascariensis TaxID=2747483 RepID=A0A8X6YEA9_9ARAC|nr:activating signal cointegrator 1 complex subunit 1 [Trichonephila inaurata madagascariensis]
MGSARIHPKIRPQILVDDDYEDSSLPIKHEGDKFYIGITVPTDSIGCIIGTKGNTKKQIQDDTCTKIIIPEKQSKKVDEADITITGGKASNVARAYHRISNIVQDVRWKKMGFTHFVSIPMNDESIQKRFLSFKNDVLSNCRGSGINEGIFESPAKLHLTIAMLTLMTNREKEEAAAMLQKYKDNILQLLDEKSLHIEIKGVEYMNDEPESVTVLYGKVRETDSDNCLQIIANQLSKVFAESPLGMKALSNDPDNVKLHVTLMKGRTGVRGYRETFDARQILEKYADYSFGETTVKEIHISIRFSSGKDAYYKPFYVLEL